VLCNTGYGEVTSERINSRNGYRSRQLDTRVGSIPGLGTDAAERVAALFLRRPNSHRCSGR
jgi:hypothetical protein